MLLMLLKTMATAALPHYFSTIATIAAAMTTATTITTNMGTSEKNMVSPVAATLSAARIIGLVTLRLRRRVHGIAV